jgi:hypothetical protein
VLGAIKQVSDGAWKGSAATWRDDSSGAEVVAMGAIYTSWGLDDWAWSRSGVGGANPTSSTYQRMIKNVFDRYSGGVAPEFDAGVAPDSGSEFDAGVMADADPVEKDVGVLPDVETVDVADVGAADTFVPMPDSAATDSATQDATLDSATDGVVADAAMDSTTTVDASDDAGVTAPVEDTSSSCGCVVPGRGEGQAGVGALSLLGLISFVYARRKRTKEHPNRPSLS